MSDDSDCTVQNSASHFHKRRKITQRMTCSHATTLHIEVLLKSSDESFTETDPVREDVESWVLSRFAMLKIGQELPKDEELTYRNVIDSIRVVDYTGVETEVPSYQTSDIRLDIQVYKLRDENSKKVNSDRHLRSSSETTDDLPQARIVSLPSKSLHGTWDTLIFDTHIPKELLHLLTRMMSISRKTRMTLKASNCNRLCLLFGPPGSGKTTLARSIAQKLTIRLGGQFTGGKLVEINSHSLLSKYFSESGKLVAKLFEDINMMAEDEETLLFVLIDEVESLTSMRERAVKGSDCNDALRATNQLLTGLDSLRARSNVIVLCTSNLLTAIDTAFLDRVHIKEYVPQPGANARYQILRSCFNELLQCNEICEHAKNGLQRAGFSEGLIPTYDQLYTHSMHQPDSVGYRLWQIAKRCEGMSGRTLSHLPLMAILRHTFNTPCTINEAFCALSVAVEDDIRVRAMQGL